ncbi:mCG141823, partial [Mus musculus]
NCPSSKDCGGKVDPEHCKSSLNDPISHKRTRLRPSETPGSGCTSAGLPGLEPEASSLCRKQAQQLLTQNQEVRGRRREVTLSLGEKCPFTWRLPHQQGFPTPFSCDALSAMKKACGSVSTVPPTLSRHRINM